jgi:hypothetical protein
LDSPDVELSQQQNEFLATFPATNFGTGTLAGVDTIMGGIALAADDADPANYFKSFGKAAIVRNFKMISNKGDRYVRKAKEVESILKSDSGWYMLRRDYDQYAVIRPLRYVIEAKDPMDPMLCSLFLVLSYEDSDVPGTWERFVKYMSRLGHGYSESTSFGGKVQATPAAGNISASGFAPTHIANAYGNVWTLWDSGIKDALLCVGDRMDLTPLQHCSRNDVGFAGLGISGGAATLGATPAGSLVPLKPRTVPMIPDETPYQDPVGEFPLVGCPLVDDLDGKHNIVIGPARPFYNWWLFQNITISNWEYLEEVADGATITTDAELIARIFPDLVKDTPLSGSVFNRQNINMWQELERIWTPSLRPSKGRRILESLIDMPYEGFKRVLDMQAAHAPSSLIVQYLSYPEVKSSRIDQAVKLVLKLQDAGIVQRGSDAMPNAHYDERSPGQKKSDERRKSSPRKSNFKRNKSRGGGGRRPWLPKAEYEAKKKMEREMGKDAPVADKVPEFKPETIDEKGATEK